MKLSRLLLAWLIAATTAAQASDIVGLVSIQTTIRARPTGPRQSQYPSTPPSVDDEVQNVVVYVEKVDAGTFTIPPAHPQMIQSHKSFWPDVLPIVAGQTVDFPNNDPIFHDVYSESKGYEFEVTGYRGGDSRSRQFTNPGVVELFCGIHSGMNAYILVLQNPFFAKPNDKHQFRIHGLPAGHYVLRAWHPRVDVKSVNVDVPAHGDARVNFEL